MRRSNALGSSSRAPTIGLFGYFGCGNSGNDGTLEVMLTYLRRTYPNARLVCICRGPKLISARHAIATINMDRPGSAGRARSGPTRLLLALPRRMADWIYALRHTRGLDVLLVPGTGALDDFGTGPRGIPAALLNWCLAAKLSGARLGFVSVGAGPIRHPLSRWMMKTAAALADYRSYRDTGSKRFMESIGLRADDRVFPDMAFRLPNPQVPKELAGASDDVVGVGVMAYRGWQNHVRHGPAIYERYQEKLARLITWLLEQGYRVRLLTGDEQDERAVADLRGRLATLPTALTGERLIAEPTTSLHELMAQIAPTIIVIGTRFHNVLCALKLCKPTISLGYSGKHDELMADLGLGEYCHHVETFDVDRVITQFLQLRDNRRAIEDLLVERTSRYYRYLDEQDDIIRNQLLDRILN